MFDCRGSRGFDPGRGLRIDSAFKMLHFDHIKPRVFHKILISDSAPAFFKFSLNSDVALVMRIDVC